MAIGLSEGQKADLTKGNPGLSKLVVGLGWDTNKYDGGAAFDLDAAAFLLGANGKVQADVISSSITTSSTPQVQFSIWAATLVSLTKPARRTSKEIPPLKSKERDNVHCAKNKAEPENNIYKGVL